MGVGAGLYMYDVVVKKFMFSISSVDEFFVGIVRKCVTIMQCYPKLFRNLFSLDLTETVHITVLLQVRYRMKRELLPEIKKLFAVSFMYFQQDGARLRRYGRLLNCCQMANV